MLYQLSYAHHFYNEQLEIDNDQLKFIAVFNCAKNSLVRPSGLEPLTYSLEGCCSIRLSYGRSSMNNNQKIKNFFFLSGRQDSNLRPPAPKAGAITGLRYAP
jgi:hypothetical protein